jgi:hypothetical protein
MMAIGYASVERGTGMELMKMGTNYTRCVKKQLEMLCEDILPAFKICFCDE